MSDGSKWWQRWWAWFDWVLGVATRLIAIGAFVVLMFSSYAPRVSSFVRELLARAVVGTEAFEEAVPQPGTATGSITDTSVWRSGGAEMIRLIHQDEGICFLTGISGSLHDDESIVVEVPPDSDGYWVLQGLPDHHLGGGASARCWRFPTPPVR